MDNFSCHHFAQVPKFLHFRKPGFMFRRDVVVVDDDAVFVGVDAADVAVAVAVELDAVVDYVANVDGAAVNVSQRCCRCCCRY